MQRFKIDARMELTTAEARLASARRSAEHGEKESSRAISAATIPALERRCEELRAEIERLPERPAFNFHGSGNFPCLTRTVPFNAAELEDFPEIPDFLRRQAAGKLAEEPVEW